MSSPTSFTLSSAPAFTGAVLASDPAIVRVGDTYRLTYTDYDPQSGHTIVSTAVSDDGITWRDIRPLVTAANGLAHNFESSEILTVGDRTLIYAAGYDDGTPYHGFPASLYAFEMTAGAAVPVSSTPVLAPTPGWYDNDATYSPTVVEHDGGYVMFYVGHAYFDTSLIEHGGVALLAATSMDGVTWTKRPQPIFTTGDGPQWAADGIAEPDLAIGPDGTVHLFFTGLHGEERVIGYASAPDLFGPFTFAPDPIVTPQSAGDGVAQTLAPTAVLDGDAVSLWYLAYDTDGAFKIVRSDGHLDGLAEAGPAGSPADVAPELEGHPPVLEPAAAQLKVVGGRGADVLLGGSGDDKLFGRAGDDTLDGAHGNDTILGSGGKDLLIGDDGDDKLVGGSGNDVLVGGAGDDLLKGSGGADRFVFGAGFGQDRVVGFQVGRDALEIDLPPHIIEKMEVRSDADGLTLSFGGDTITLDGLTPHQFDDIEFIFT